MSRGGWTHRVEFYRPVETVDDAGQKSVSYVFDFASTVDAKVDRSQKRQEYDQVETGSDTVRIYMDMNSRVAVDWRVSWEGSDWDVKTVRDPDGRRIILEVTAERYGQ